MARRTPLDAQVYADENRVIVILDGCSPRDPEGKRLHGGHILGDAKLRFSVTRGGTFKFSKKTKATACTKRVHVLDEEGNKIPDPIYQKEMKGYGYSSHPEFQIELVVQDEPHIETAYDVDREWWRRYTQTRVTI